MDPGLLEFVGPPQPSSPGRDLRIVYSDLIGPEFRHRKERIEFPLGLDVLESYLRSLGYTHGDYAFLPSQASMLEMGSSGRLLTTLGVRGQAPYPVRKAAMWGINVMNYLQAPAFFQLLSLAGVPALRSERAGGQYPLVVLGGHIWPNPLPLSDFYDILVVGDGEEVLARIAGLCERFGSRRGALLAAAAELEGAYVPGLTRHPVRRARIDFQDPAYPAGSSYLLDGVGAIMLARGCPYTCAFCNNSLVSGAYRTKPASQVMAHIDRLADAGARTILPLATSASTYQSGQHTIYDILQHIEARGATVKTLSDRPERITPEYLRLTVPENGKVILAPEAGPRIRERVLHKTLLESTIRELVSQTIAAGIRRIQLYSILCVPSITPGVVDYLPRGFDGEQSPDLRYLAELACSIADQMLEAGLPRVPGKPYVQLDCMPFIPAIGTRLQTTTFPSFAHYQARLRALEGMLGPYYQDLVEVDAAMDQATHLLQAFLERGEARAGTALWQVWREQAGTSTVFLNQMSLEQVRQAMQACGQSWASISAEVFPAQLPYAGLIEVEDGRSSCSA